MYISGKVSSLDIFKDFIIKRARRLLIPFVIAVPILLIPRLYMGQEYEEWTRVKPDNSPDWNYFSYVYKVIPTILQKLSWLWFLPVLFLIGILNFPLQVWSERRQ